MDKIVGLCVVVITICVCILTGMSLHSHCCGSHCAPAACETKCCPCPAPVVKTKPIGAAAPE